MWLIFSILYWGDHQENLWSSGWDKPLDGVKRVEFDLWLWWGMKYDFNGVTYIKCHSAKGKIEILISSLIGFFYQYSLDFVKGNDKIEGSDPTP